MDASMPQPPADESPAKRLFSENYGRARESFVSAAKLAGAHIRSFECPAGGPDGERLWTDVARIGSDSPKVGVFLLSGVHGAEGFFGSAYQVKVLREKAQLIQQQLGPDATLFLVHAVNPFGFAYMRRTNEDNVDLNRNFVDFSRALRPDQGYEEIHDFLVPSDLNGPVREQADRGISGYIAERGMGAFLSALTQGQYTRPLGLFYGGSKPSWSRQTWFQLVDELASTLRRAAIIDFHTGLGNKGEIEVILFSPDQDRAAKIWGEKLKSLSGSILSSAIIGTLLGATCERYPQVDFTTVAIELGTLPPLEVLTAMRDDAWVIANPGCDRTLMKSIGARNRASFMLEDDDWQALAMRHGDWVLGRLLESLKGSKTRI
jgi:uncharacterized protein DUF2817